jgi:hypothetical protein
MHNTNPGALIHIFAAGGGGGGDHFSTPSGEFSHFSQKEEESGV